MPRNGSGTYTLPSGNPVESGTVIDANWANTTLTDIGAELTNSLSRTGAGGMLAPFRIADGNSYAPGLSFTNETTSGLYRASVNNISMTVGGVRAMTWSNANVVVPSSINFVASVGTPSSSTDIANKAYVDALVTASTPITTRQVFTATAGQTTFSISYTPGYIDVFLNGVKQVLGTDFTATNGSSVVFAVALAENDTVDLIGYGTYALNPGVDVISTDKTASKNTVYVLTASLTLTLPATPVVGDTVKVSNMSGTITCVVARNGEKIQGVAEDMTIDSPNTAITLVYANSTLGWVLS